MDYLIKVEKQLGSWTNDGGCESTGDDYSCGPGNQKQTRICISGTTDKCSNSDRRKTISCSKPLPECVGKGQ